MKKILSIILGVTILFSSCSKDFLETNSSTAMQDNLVYKTTKLTKGVLYGIYRLMRSANSGGQNRMDCCGLPSNLIVFDMLGSDLTMTSTDYYWLDYDYFNTKTDNNYRTSYFWTFYYRVINNCNDILFNVDNTLGTEEEKARIKGEALSLRAMCYFHLVQIYQQTYILAKDLPGVPVYTEPTTPEQEGKPRSKVEEVYKLIVEDLKTAILYLDDKRETKYYINKNVAEGLLARVYLTMNKWEDAAEMANAAKVGYPLMSAEEWVSGFNDISNKEWIWGIYQSIDQNVGWGSYTSIFDYVDGNRRNVRMPSSFYKKYSKTDVRITVLAKKGNNYGSRKFKETNPKNICHVPLMRTAEMILIEAECKARLGNEPEAQKLLFNLVSTRDPNYTKSTNTGNDLIEEILIERRKELWGEGFSYFDMLRNQKPLVRGSDHRSTKNFEANSWMLIHKIPRKELDINPYINEEDQNPVDGVFGK